MTALASLQAFLQSSRECLTPRGLSQTIGTTSKQYVPADTLQAAGSQLLHDFYIWNGREAHPLARAGSLAGALRAEKKIKKKHYSDLLKILFYREVRCSLSLSLHVLTYDRLSYPLVPSFLLISTLMTMIKVSSSQRTGYFPKCCIRYASFRTVLSFDALLFTTIEYLWLCPVSSVWSATRWLQALPSLDGHAAPQGNAKRRRVAHKQRQRAYQARL